MEQCQVAAAAAALRSAVDQLLEADLVTPDGPALAALFAEVEVQRRRLEAVDHALVAALEDRGLAGEFGQASTLDLLREVSRIAPAEAKARVRAARDLGPRRDLAGQRLSPVFARVADAQRDGSISQAHARVIIRCLCQIPAAVSSEAAGPAEAFLVEQARHFDARQVAVIAERLLATLDPDGAEPRDERQYARRGYGFVRGRHGARTVAGETTDDFYAVWAPILDVLSAPQPSAEGLPDDRTATQRCHDGMLDLGKRLLRSGMLPDAGGVPTTVLLNLTADDLTEEFTGDDVEGTVTAGCGPVRTGTGGYISGAAALRLAEQCELFATVFDKAGSVLCAGRSRRLASRVQRRILAARDGGCCFPGCTRPPSWCEAHHVLPWLLGGATDIDNLVLLCGFHHREFDRRGWTVHITNGIPEWLPPVWLDPDQTPRRNTAHHLPDTAFLAQARTAYRAQRQTHDQPTSDHSGGPEPPDP